MPARAPPPPPPSPPSVGRRPAGHTQRGRSRRQPAAPTSINAFSWVGTAGAPRPGGAGRGQRRQHRDDDAHVRGRLDRARRPDGRPLRRADLLDGLGAADTRQRLRQRRRLRSRLDLRHRRARLRAIRRRLVRHVLGHVDAGDARRRRRHERPARHLLPLSLLDRRQRRQPLGSLGGLGRRDRPRRRRHARGQRRQQRQRCGQPDNHQARRRAAERSPGRPGHRSRRNDHRHDLVRRLDLARALRRGDRQRERGLLQGRRLERARLTWSWSAGGSVKASGGIIAYAGIDDSAPVDAFAGQANATSTTNIQAPSITTAFANDMLVFFAGSTSGPATNVHASRRNDRALLRAPPSPERVPATRAADAIQATAGATGTRTGTQDAVGSSVRQLLALAPDTTAQYADRLLEHLLGRHVRERLERLLPAGGWRRQLHRHGLLERRPVRLRAAPLPRARLGRIADRHLDLEHVAGEPDLQLDDGRERERGEVCYRLRQRRQHGCVLLHRHPRLHRPHRLAHRAGGGANVRGAAVTVSSNSADGGSGVASAPSAPRPVPAPGRRSPPTRPRPTRSMGRPPSPTGSTTCAS